jgi:hypothetical protein
MMERLSGLPNGVEGIKASGKLAKEDYERVVEPLLDEARREGRRLRVFCEVGPDFQGFTPSAAWEDVRVGFRSLRLLDGIALVTDIGWMKEATRASAFFMPCPMRAFGLGDRDQAIAWLAALPEAAGVAHRMIPETGVLVVEAHAALRTQDFDSIGVTVDSWIESHGSLQGLVIHAKKFPGWENLGSMMRHLEFVRDHQRKINRIALCVDGQVANIVPELAKHFLHAKVQAFGYDGLERAIAWAGGGKGPEGGTHRVSS